MSDRRFFIQRENLRLLSNDKELSASARRILDVHWAKSSFKGWSYLRPAVEAERIGMSVSSFYKYRGVLVNKGLLVYNVEKSAHRVLGPDRPWMCNNGVYEIIPHEKSATRVSKDGGGEDEDSDEADFPLGSGREDAE